LALYQHNDSGVFWYDFKVDETHCRGSTENKLLGEARMIESQLIAKSKEYGSGEVRPQLAPTLRDFSSPFWDWSKNQGQNRPPSATTDTVGV
jgi:hypothetical protein